MTLKERCGSLPLKPGVYLMKGPSGEVLYVGKARKLRARVRSYFQARSSPGRDTRPLVRFLMDRVSDVDYIVTDTDKEALILEDTLIKKYRPKYNVRFRDDKTYINLRLTIKDEFPRLHIVRRPARDGSMIFGPYPSSQAVRETLKLVLKIFQLRTCSDHELANRTRPCMQYQIKKCSAPCVGYVKRDQYMENVHDVILFLQGKGSELVKALVLKMMRASEKEDFEEAARIRDLITSVQKTIEKQKVVLYYEKDMDVFAGYRDKGSMAIQVLNMRRGVLLGAKAYVLKTIFPEDRETISSFLYQYYFQGCNVIPDEIALQEKLEGGRALAERLGELKGGRVKFVIPKRGELHRLVKMAVENARASLTTEKGQEDDTKDMLRRLKDKLGLKTTPRRIEAYDMSNISGSLAVGSLVMFENGKALKDGYRRFKIKDADGRDDCGMMYEVFYRRFSEAWDNPDLVIVDGGKGQLNAALKALEEKGKRIDAVSFAKGEDEKVYVPHVKNPISLKEGSGELLFLQRIRDEAHRFAVSYNIKLREKRDLSSVLDEVAGIGEKRKVELLRHFASVERIKEAGVDEIAQVPLVGMDLAQEIFNHFHPA